MDNSLSCQNLAPFAKKTYAATGALVEGVPLICGGYYPGGSYSDECSQITKSMTSLVTNMTSKRGYAASVVLNKNQLWVMGGRSSSTYLKSTEFIQIGAGSTSGPDLPLAIASHAIVAWTSSSFMLIGGDDENYLAKTFYYHVEKPDEWIPGPELKQERGWHAAGLGMDRATNDPYIAVTGGYKSGYLDSVELLYEGETEWQAGKHQ